MQLTLEKPVDADSGEVWGAQDQLPPLKVPARIVLELPTAMQLVVVGQLTAWRSCGVPEGDNFQSRPPVVVYTIVPSKPTATHEFVLGQLMPRAPPKFNCGFQGVAPPLMVAKIQVPAAKQVFVLGQLIASRVEETPPPRD